MKTINATKGEFVGLINGLFKVQSLPGKRLGLVVSSNILTLQGALKDLEEMGTPTPEFMELAQQINTLAQSGSEEDKAEIERLEIENDKLVAERQEQMEKVQEEMKATMEVELKVITEDLLPETISGEQITGIHKILE
jgi:hypothetical protein